MAPCLPLEHCKRPIQAVQRHECPNEVERQRSGRPRPADLDTAWRGAGTRFGGPRHFSAVREFLARGLVGRGRPVLFPARLCLRQPLPGAAERIRHPGDFFRDSTTWVDHTARSYCEMIKSRLRLTGDSHWSSWQATTATF